MPGTRRYPRAVRLIGINRYPIKSCRGQALDTATVEPWGLAGDRRWLVVDEDGDLITARESPRLLLVTPTTRAGAGLSLASPDAPELSVDVPSEPSPVPVRVWRSRLDASLVSGAADAWFSKILGRDARLVYLDDPTQRHPNPAFAQPDDVVNFADGYPLNVATRTSLDALNDLIVAGDRGDEGPLPMTRFRPNLVVDGDTAWAEDGWRRMRIGSAVFRVVKGCDRCVMTVTDPDDASRGKEPLRTLAKHRRFDGATWFGMQLLPDTPGAEIRLGDDVEILEAVNAPDGPPR